VMLCGREGNRR